MIGAANVAVDADPADAAAYECTALVSFFVGHFSTLYMSGAYS